MKTWNDWWKETKPAECDEYKDYFCECWHVSQSEQYKKDKEKIDALMTALERCVSYIADLNGSDWINGDDCGSLDMRQRARALQKIGFDACSKAKGE